MLQTAKHFRVGLMLDPCVGLGYPIAEGVAEQARTLPDWYLSHFEFYSGRLVLPKIAWELDGLITTCKSRESAEQLAALPCVVVNVSGSLDPPPPDSVLGDDWQIGTLAAESLLSLGHRQFGVVTYGDKRRYMIDRAEGFAVTVRASGGTYLGTAKVDEPDETAWFAELPRPVGLFLVNDFGGPALLAELARHQIDVPDDAAIVAAGQMTSMSQLLRPQLSTIDGDPIGRGRRAAELLDALMRGDAVSQVEPIRVPPLGVTMRASSDALAVGDEMISQALSYLRAHFCEEVDFEDVAGAAGTSRRTLERRVRQRIGRSLAEELYRLRLNEAKRLLAMTTLDTVDVALRSGFISRSALSHAFRKHLDTTPTAYRQTYRGTH